MMVLNPFRWLADLYESNYQVAFDSSNRPSQFTQNVDGVDHGHTITPTEPHKVGYFSGRMENQHITYSRRMSNSLHDPDEQLLKLGRSSQLNIEGERRGD
jgi:hypothetical protein